MICMCSKYEETTCWKCRNTFAIIKGTIEARMELAGKSKYLVCPYCESKNYWSKKEEPKPVVKKRWWQFGRSK